MSSNKKRDNQYLQNSKKQWKLHRHHISTITRIDTHTKTQECYNTQNKIFQWCTRLDAISINSCQPTNQQRQSTNDKLWCQVTEWQKNIHL